MPTTGKRGKQNEYEIPGANIVAGGSVSVATVTDSSTIFDGTPSYDDSKLTYTLKSSATEEHNATVTLKVTSDNYNDYNIVVTIGVAAKTEVTVNLAGGTYTYNGSTQSPTISVSGNKVDVNTLVKTYNGREGTTYNDNTAPTNAGKYTVTVKVPDANNEYKGSATCNFEIGKKTLTATIEAEDKIYDDSASATVTAELAGVVGDDDVTAKVTSAAFENKTVGEGKIVTANVELEGTAKGNYELISSSVTATAKIIAKEVTIKDVKIATTKTYDGGTTADITESGRLDGVVSGDTVNIKVGAATYDNKNVGTTKTVTFSGFSLDGADEENYKLNEQPASITAVITPKNLTIENLAVADKTYDGTNTATISGIPTLNGVVSGDTVILTNGTPNFTSVNVGANIAINFTPFSITGDAAKNYTLTQSSGITASITAYNAAGNEYTFSSNKEWTNQDFVVTAADGWQLSYTNTAEGEWSDSLTKSEETDSGTLEFYVKNTVSGVISEKITKTYKIDKTVPSITGAEDGKTYCAAVTLTITDQNLDSVTLNGAVVTLTDGKLTINPKAEGQTVVATDKAGNSKTLTVKVNNGHTWDAWQSNNDGTHSHSCTIIGCEDAETANCSGGEATCTEKAVCATCETAYGEVNADNHTGSKTWTKTPTTHEQKWSCCTAVTVASENHEWHNGVCAECEYVCEHTGVTDDGNCLTPVICGVCGKTLTAAESTHSWGRYTVTTPATTENEGEETRSCQHSGCTVEQIRTIAKLTPTPVPVQKYRIGGEVVDSENNRLIGAGVTLVLGDRQIATATTDESGKYTFGDIEPGVYNLVASNDGATKTVKVEITKSDVAVETIKMPQGKTSSVVEVKGDENQESVEAVVGNLDEIFTDEKANEVYTNEDKATATTGGGSVEIKLIVDKKAEEKIADEITEVLKTDTRNNVGMHLDIKVEKTVTQSGGEAEVTSINDTGVLLETVIKLPSQLQGKQSYTVYRLHGDEVQALTTAKNEAGEYIEISSDRKSLTIHAKYYSEYVIAYQEKSSSSGGGHTAAYQVITPVQPKEGGILVSPKTAEYGETVTVTLKPEEGYEADAVTVLDKDGKAIEITDKGDGTYTFKMPIGNVTVSATFKKAADKGKDYTDCPKDVTCPIDKFTDAENTAWYHDGVHYCLENGLMKGMSSTEFLPDGNVTRAQIVTILWRIEGSKVVNYAMKFKDVANDSWYAEAIRWAASEDVVTGYSDEAFGPNDSVTREQLATILYRYAKYKGMDVTGKVAELDKFSDGASVSAYALPAMKWAVGSQIINGTTVTTLSPKGTATRAQAASLMQRFLTGNK